MAFQYFPDAPMYSQGVLLAINVRGTAELGGAGHVSMDNFESGGDIIFDWLAEILSALPEGDVDPR
jgi:hypothetical protein